MLWHRWTVRPPPSVTVLPLPHNHRVSMLLPLGTHLSFLFSHFPTPFYPSHSLSHSLRAPPALLPSSPTHSSSLWNFTRTRDTHSQHSGSVGTSSSFPTVVAMVPASFSPSLPSSSFSSSSSSLSTRRQQRWRICFSFPSTLSFSFLFLSPLCESSMTFSELEYEIVRCQKTTWISSRREKKEKQCSPTR